MISKEFPCHASKVAREASIMHVAFTYSCVKESDMLEKHGRKYECIPSMLMFPGFRDGPRVGLPGQSRCRLSGASNVSNFLSGCPTSYPPSTSNRGIFAMNDSTANWPIHTPLLLLRRRRTDIAVTARQTSPNVRASGPTVTRNLHIDIAEAVARPVVQALVPVHAVSAEEIHHLRCCIALQLPRHLRGRVGHGEGREGP